MAGALSGSSRGAGNPDAVDLLLRAGARPNARSQSGNTARSIAAFNGYDRIVRLLDSAGATRSEAIARGTP